MTDPERERRLILRLKAVADRHGLDYEELVRGIGDSLVQLCDRLEREHGPAKARELLRAVAAGKITWEDLGG